MKKHFMISIWMTIVTTLLLGVIYPLVVTALAQVLFPQQANGSLISANGTIVGGESYSRLAAGVQFRQAHGGWTRFARGTVNRGVPIRSRACESGPGVID